MQTIILASTSPRRKEIFSLLKLPFSCVAHKYDEENNLQLKPADLVLHLSKMKALSLADDFPDAIIIGSDTLVELNNKILAKPKNNNEAIEMLLSLSGATHNILTGYTIINTKTKKECSGLQKTEITFRNISRDEASVYTNWDEVLQFAGAYDHEHLGAIFAEQLNGDFFGSIGLPLFLITKSLKENFGVDVLKR